VNSRFFLLVLSTAVFATLSVAPVFAATTPCTVSAFEALNLPETTILLVESLPAGPNSAPVGNIALPICRVRGVIAPANLFEVWMPTAGWNGKFQGVGNGGLAGSISFGDMRTALSRNYATASTDTGHSSNAPGDPWWTNAQQIKDYGYRSIHEMTVKAKAIINAFYGAEPNGSYFVGCSTGGRQAFMEAQRYPEDYDGIIAGAPVYRVIELRARHVWTWQCNHRDPTGAHAIPVTKLPAIFRAVMAACDHLDGLVDGQVDDPRRCRFNPTSLLCTDADSDTCLTAAQIETLKCMYAGPVNPRTKRQIYPGVPATSELDQGQSIGAVPNPAYTTFFQHTVFEDPNYDFLTFNFDTDVKFALTKEFEGETLKFIHHAEDPDLTAFRRRGGKMIIWHGWSDPLPNPGDTIDYYKKASDFRDRDRYKTAFRHHLSDDEEFLRLFLLPNVGHCGGAAPGGPNTWDPLTALERWVEDGIAPDEIIASRVTDGVVTRTRPICAYPQVARYVGSGSIDDAANFVCREPRDRGRDYDNDQRAAIPYQSDPSIADAR
jgi:feruloyl esterase